MLPICQRLEHIYSLDNIGYLDFIHTLGTILVLDYRCRVTRYLSLISRNVCSKITMWSSFLYVCLWIPDTWCITCMRIILFDFILSMFLLCMSYVYVCSFYYVYMCSGSIECCDESWFLPLLLLIFMRG